MKMLVSMLFMGMVSSRVAVLRSVLSGEDREVTPRCRNRGSWVPGVIKPEVGDRLSFEPDVPGDEASPEALLEHFSRAQTLQGRLSLHALFIGRRISAFVRADAAPMMKRAIDIVASFTLLVLLLPVFALIAIAVKLDGGSVFFAQTRVGRFGREFKMYKVRSMCVDAEKKLQTLLEANEHKEGVTFKLKRDPRITGVGRWLRKFSLDELPQLYNVLIGDMSLVGPRPPVPREVAKYTLADRRRLLVAPGITCIWQISGRSEIDFSGQVKLDVQYIEHQNLWTDLHILVRTLPAVISGRGAC